MGSGTGKCGWPIERLTGFLRLRPSSNTRRTPESSMARARSAIQRSFIPYSGLSPFEDLVGAAAGLGQALGNAVEFLLHLGHGLGPFMGVERQTAMDQIDQFLRGGCITNIDGLKLPRPEFTIEV